MATSELELRQLPETLTVVRSRPLFVMRLDVSKPDLIGQTPAGIRRVGVIHSGKFEGERLSGQVIDGGSDWQTMRPDDILTLDVRLVLKTDDDASLHDLQGTAPWSKQRQCAH